MSALARRIGSVASLSFLANLAVLLKNAAIAARFGAGGTADLLAYGEAILIFLPTILLLRECFGIFVSIYGRHLETDGAEAAAGLSAAALRGVLLIGVALSLVVLLAPRFLLGIMAPGLSPEQMAQGAWILRLISPALVFQEVAEFARGLHNAHHRYVMPGAVLLAGNLVQAALLIAFPVSAALGAWILALNSAALLQAAILVLTAPGARLPLGQGAGPRWSLLRPGAPWHPEFRRLGRVVAPVALGVLLIQFAGWLERAVLSYMAEGSLATLAYSRKLLAPIQTLLAASVALPIYVQMSRSRDEDAGYRAETLARGVQVDLFLFVPITLLVWILAPEIVSLAFRRGLFGERDVLGTSPLLRVGVLAVLPAALLLLLRDFIYTSGKTRPLMYAGLIQLVVTGAANLFLARRYGLIWVPCGVVAGTWITFLVLFLLVRARNPQARLGLAARDLVVLSVAGAAGAAAALGLKTLAHRSGPGFLGADLSLLALAGVGGLVAYSLVALLLGHPLARRIWERFARAR